MGILHSTLRVLSLHLIVMFECRLEVAERFPFAATAKALQNLAQIVVAAARQSEREKLADGVHLVAEAQVAVQSVMCSLQ